MSVDYVPPPPPRLPWAPSFGWLTGRQCHARLHRDGGEQIGRWGRCELEAGHAHPLAKPYPEQDHCLDHGMEVVRWSGDGVCRDSSLVYAESGFGR